MKFCQKILTELNFEPHSISPCCNTWGIAIPAFPYEGGWVDLEAYAAHIEKTLMEIQANGKVCRNCFDLEESDSLPAMSGRFRAISINMHRYYCNCKCVYCNFWKNPGKGRGYDILPGLESLAAQGALEPNAWLSWGGGEPSILPTFEEASKWALEKGLFQMIHTNAIKFSESIMAILASGRGRINISLDSGSSEVYASVKGLDAFDRVYGNIKRYSTANPDSIELKYIVFEKNNSAREIDAFLNLARRLNIKNIEMSFNFKEMNKNVVSSQTLAAAAYMALKARMMDFNLSTFFIPDKWQKALADEINAALQ